MKEQNVIEPVEESIPTLVELGKKLRKARRDREWSEEFTGKKVGVSRSTITRIEHGNYRAGVSVIIELCREFDIRSIKIID